MKLNMASTADTSLKSVTRPFPRSERRLQKKLRSTGQEYVSRTGKIVPAKKVPGMFQHTIFINKNHF